MGRRPEAPSVKAARGTYRKDRDDNKFEFQVPDSPPRKPESLSEAACEIWDDQLEHVIAAGNKEVDSAFFARYCKLEALCNEAFEINVAPPASHLSEVNKMAIRLGIAGPSSRTLVAMSEPEGKPKQSNPFGGFGKR